ALGHGAAVMVAMSVPASRRPAGPGRSWGRALRPDHGLPAAGADPAPGVPAMAAGRSAAAAAGAGAGAGGVAALAQQALRRAAVPAAAGVPGGDLPVGAAHRLERRGAAAVQRVRGDRGLVLPAGQCARLARTG